MANPETMLCEKGHQVTADADAVNFCRICGAPLLRKCPEGHLSKADGRFCRVCGKPMGITASENEPSVRPEPVASARIGTETTMKLSQRAEDHGTTSPDPVVVPAPSVSGLTLPVADSSGEDAHPARSSAARRRDRGRRRSRMPATHLRSDGWPHAPEADEGAIVGHSISEVHDVHDVHNDHPYNGGAKRKAGRPGALGAPGDQRDRP